jgi:hypothetical protein
MLYYLLNESKCLDEERFWAMINQEFSSGVESKVMTLAQKLKARSREETRIEMVKRLLQENQGVDFISRVTFLSLEQIKMIQENLNTR